MPPDGPVGRFTRRSMIFSLFKGYISLAKVISYSRVAFSFH